MSSFLSTLVFCVYFCIGRGLEPAAQCREHSNQLRQDGELCFEIPPWQLQPVELESHLDKLRQRFGNVIANRRTPAFISSEVTRYMDTVLAPFLDTYHRNIQTSYQQLTTKILKRIKDEINEAVQRKNKIYTNLTQLADKLNVPEICEEERRAAKTIASTHVANIYKCTEDARVSIAKMGKYAERMISITRSHMQMVLETSTNDLNEKYPDDSITNTRRGEDVKYCLKELSRAAVTLGFELDLSLTNARRHNEQSCEKLTSCSSEAKRNADDAVVQLREQLYQCVYA